MRNQLFSLLIILISTSLTAQQKALKNIKKTEIDQLEITKQPNFNNDTIWVCDSTLQYTGDGEKYGKDEVLSRNILGNVTASKYTMMSNPSGVYDYPHFDTINYFNDNENILSKIRSVYIASSDSWLTSVLYCFQSPYMMKEEFNKSYSSSSQEFVGDGYKKYYVYNNNNKLDTLFQFYLPDNNWENQSFIKYYYDEFGNDTLHLEYKWADNDYELDSKEQKVYLSGKLIHRYSSVWDNNNSQWQNEIHMYYSFNEFELHDTIIQQNWQQESNSWRIEAKNLITYDANQRIISYLSQVYNYSTELLENYMLSTNIYENNNYTNTYQRWENNQWLNYFRYFYSYIDDTRKDTTKRSDWDTSLNEWIPDTQTITNYDFRANAKHYTRKEYTDNQWKTIKTYDYYWSPFNTDFINTENISQLLTYPNPATSKVNISIAKGQATSNTTIKIFSLTGSKVDEINMNNGNGTWDCTGANPGIYFYSGKIDGKKYAGKIIVK